MISMHNIYLVISFLPPILTIIIGFLIRRHLIKKIDHLKKESEKLSHDLLNNEETIDNLDMLLNILKKGGDNEKCTVYFLIPTHKDKRCEDFSTAAKTIQKIKIGHQRLIIDNLNLLIKEEVKNHEKHR